MQQRIYLIGLNHKTADVEIRERFALAECLAEEGPGPVPVGGAIKEAVVLSTCNRVEALVSGEDERTPREVLEYWATARGQKAEDLEPFVYIHEGRDAVTHLFRVASSLDSMVVGEPQILGQLKEAYRKATKRGATKVVLNRLVHKAFSVAKRVRTETAIGSSAVSISYAAVELAKRIFGDMGKYTAMLIGAGEMAELAATHLLNSGVRNILVANRTYERGRELAKHFNGEAIVWEELHERLAEADIVISSTGSPTAIIRARDIKGVLKRRKNRPMFFIDIAVPRDIDPDVNNLDNIYLYDIDDLKEVVEENMAQRREEAARAAAIVEEEAAEFGLWLKSLDLHPTIVDLLERGEAVGRRELAKTMKRLGPDTDDATREALEVLIQSLVRKLYHDPIAFLRRRSQEEDSVRRYLDFTRRMFNLDDDQEVKDGHPHRRTRREDETSDADN